MRVFLTSATGHVGGAVAGAFLGAGHDVTALTRSAERAEHLARRGIRAVPGDLREPATYAQAAAAHEVVVHTAFEYDAEGREVLATDRTAVDALLRALAATERKAQLVYTSSAFLLGGLSTETMDELVPTEGASPRSAVRLETERRVLSAAEGYLRTAAIRLGVVYGGASFTMNELFSSAEREGRVVYRVVGESRWPMVHLQDMAALYVRVAEQGATGVFHAVDGCPLPVMRIAEIASAAAGCGGKVSYLPLEAVQGSVREHDARVESDVPVVATRSLELGWRPKVRSFDEGAAEAFRDWQALRRTG